MAGGGRRPPPDSTPAQDRWDAMELRTKELEGYRNWSQYLKSKGQQARWHLGIADLKNAQQFQHAFGLFETRDPQVDTIFVEVQLGVHTTGQYASSLLPEAVEEALRCIITYCHRTDPQRKVMKWGQIAKELGWRPTIR